MSFYPPNIQARLRIAKRVEAEEPSALGRVASLACGSFIEFKLSLGNANDLTMITFRTNGCGYMIAAADLLCETLRGKNISEFHGLDNNELTQEVFNELDIFPDERAQCLDICFEALHNAFADLRLRRIEEFRGEKALICTCFGVTEDEIERYIAANSPSDVETVTRDCRAGSGCGSCLMLIREMLETNML